MKSPSSSWPALWICKEILEHVISKMHVTPRLAVLLKRTSPVPPARTGKTDERRPSKQFVTMAVDKSQLERHFHKIKAGDVVVLVDDIVTSGSTIMASAWHVKSCLPSVEVRAFTLFRTQQDYDPCKYFEPVVGTIGYDASADWCSRDP
jgi:predicted amidophosphoribosyltransferase